MKAVFLISFLASVSANALRGWRNFHETKILSVSNHSEMVIHGPLGENHCEELYIPAREYKSFVADPHEAPYMNYSKGLCLLPFTTIDSVTRDDDFPDVVHLKRGVGASSAASLTVTNCGGSGAKATGLTFTYSKSPTKGSPTTITGTSTVPSGTSGGQFTVNAAIGTSSLVNNEKTDNCKTFTKKIFMVGTITVTNCPSGTKDTLSVTIPVPNIDGKVTAKLQSLDGSGNEILCASLVLTL